MNIKEYIKGKTLLIIPNQEKKNILNELNQESELLNIKMMSLEEFVGHYYFSYDEKTISYCLENYPYNYDVMIEYLNILPYLTKKIYSSSKLNKLVSLKDDLLKKDLLLKDLYFSYYLNQVNIVVYGYSKLDPFYIELFSKISNVTIISEEYHKKDLTVYEANHINEEISFVLSKIKHLLKKGVDISKIHLMGVSDEYINPLIRLSRWFNLPLIIEDKTTLWDIGIGKKVISLLKINKTYQEIIEQLESEHEKQAYIDQVISIFNRYLFLDEASQIRILLIKEELKKTKVKKDNHQIGLDVVPLSKVKADDYYFLLGFNLENIPKIDKGEGILTDVLKQELGLFTSVEENKLEKERVKNILYNAPNLVITTKKQTYFQEFNPSLLIEEENMKIEKIMSDYTVSHTYNKMKLVEYLDLFNKYGQLHKDLNLLYTNVELNNYRSYQNQFTGISEESLKNYLNGKLLLSYTSLDNYYRCGFRYYLSNILKIDKFESTFYTKIGTIFHQILKDCFKDDFDFDLAFEQEVNNYDFTISEKVLLVKLKSELKFDIETIHKQMNLTHFDKALYEEKFYYPVNVSSDITVTLMGIIDKILYMENYNNTLVSIIDYKTGSLPDYLNHMIHGIGMQLPIYYFLVKNSKRFDSVKIVGIFLQKIINKDLKIEDDSSRLEKLENNLKLVGYATSNENDLEEFDISYHDSGLIKSMKVGNNGFYKYSRVLSEEKFEAMENLVREKIEEAALAILKADFKINPKKIGKENVGCSFCPYKDICFYKEEDIKELKEYKDLSFLGGEIDA